ncbi:MAG: hypothetical protein HC773_15315 [Scytonema sp. CRU_2_7]|nr:hypothetical protein [Scytonema sp. CRU_2_7]
MPSKRASILLFLVETRSAHLVAKSRSAMNWFQTEKAIAERELSFYQAFTLGREPPLRPSVQDLERYAPQWAGLVPNNGSVRAALAYLIGQKYSLVYQKYLIFVWLWAWMKLRWVRHISDYISNKLIACMYPKLIH